MDWVTFQVIWAAHKQSLFPDVKKMFHIASALGLMSSIIFLYNCVRLFLNRRPRNFPPCPPTLPVLGNLHQLPRQKEYLKIAELGWKYSSHGLMGLQLGPSTMP